jgi:hypothetical protein
MSNNAEHLWWGVRTDRAAVVNRDPVGADEKFEAGSHSGASFASCIGQNDSLVDWW